MLFLTLQNIFSFIYIQCAENINIIIIQVHSIFSNNICTFTPHGKNISYKCRMLLLFCLVSHWTPPYFSLVQIWVASLQCNIIIIIIIYFSCKWILTQWQWYCNKTQHTNNSHRTKYDYEYVTETTKSYSYLLKIWIQLKPLLGRKNGKQVHIQEVTSSNFDTGTCYQVWDIL
jgi:hypothetical protein